MKVRLEWIEKTDLRKYMRHEQTRLEAVKVH